MLDPPQPKGRNSNKHVGWVVFVTICLSWLALQISMQEHIPTDDSQPFMPVRSRVSAQAHQQQMERSSLKNMQLKQEIEALHRKEQVHANVLHDWDNATHLIMVAGHTVFKGRDLGWESATSENWQLLDYQRGQLSAFLEHIQAGVDIAARDKNSLLVFSGGATRQASGPVNEALSYWLYANANDWFSRNVSDGRYWTSVKPELARRLTSSQDPQQLGDDYRNVRGRAHVEEFARDSFENLMFSICRFKQVTNRYPSEITVVSLPFKENRFKTLHRKALRYPEESFHFLGIGEASPTAQNNELIAAVRPFTEDPYGCKDLLAKKKDLRNPFNMQVPYPNGCSELTQLFRYCGRRFFGGPLPWDSLPSPAVN